MTALNERLTGLLGDRNSLKQQVQKCFDKVVRKTDNSAKVGIDVEGLRLLCKEAESDFGLPADAFGNLENTHVRFDFDGNGTLDFKEAYRCVKRAMADYLKTQGRNVRPQLCSKTPEQAGFTKVRVLGKGGQGEAILVKNAKGEELMLKTFIRESEKAGGLMELLDEAGSMALLGDCDYIAKVLEIFEDDKHFYMVSPVNYGGDWTTLQSRASKAGVALTEEWYRGIFNQAFRGLSHLHRNAVMHCDIKEENLMVKDVDYANPSVVIIDLGLSQAFFPHDKQLMGTPGFVPPETWSTSEWFPRGDVFSLGVVCLQLLTDKIPCKGKGGIFTDFCKTIDAVRDATRRRAPPFRLARPQSPEMLEWLVPCLEKERMKRPTAPQVLQKPWFVSPLPSQKDLPPPRVPEDAATPKGRSDEEDVCGCPVL